MSSTHVLTPKLPAPDPPTERLIQCCVSHMSLGAPCKPPRHFPPAEFVRECARAGANVSYRIMDRFPIITIFIRCAKIDHIMACLETTAPIDFNVLCGSFFTPFTTACNGFPSPSETREMVKLLVRRLETHPEDMVDFKVRSNLEKDLITIAAEHQKLSVVWPLVKHLPYFADRTEPLPLTGLVWESDWRQLRREWCASRLLPPDALESGAARAEDFDFFMDEPHGGELIGVEETPGAMAVAELCQLSWMDTPDPAVVQRCIQTALGDGMSLNDIVLYDDPIGEIKLLHRFLLHGDVDRVAACLFPYGTEGGSRGSALCGLSVDRMRIDLTESDFAYGRNALHFLCGGEVKTAMEVRAMLNLVLDRLELQRVETGEVLDVVDWSLRNQSSRDFLSEAAAFGRLSVVWGVLKERSTDYFMRSSPMEPLRIHSKVRCEDWECIPQEDRCRFQLLHPVKAPNDVKFVSVERSLQVRVLV